MNGFRADSIRVVHPLFQEGGGGAIPTSALQLWVEKMAFGDAKRLNRLWHSRMPRMGTGCIANQPFLSFGASFDGIWYAAAIWSNPVARALPQQTWLELRRLAVAPDSPRNTPSRMLSVMRRLVMKARPDVVRLISYQDTAAHSGGIYRAAGWKRAKVSTNKKRWTWGCESRPRPAAQSEAPKRCWDMCLVCSMNSDPCEVCRGRLEDFDGQAGTDQAERPGAEADVPLPERQQDRTEGHNALSQPSLWDASTDDG